MEFKRVMPEQSDWEKQYNITAYYGSHTIGSLVLCYDGTWHSVINGSMDDIDADTEEKAKEEMIDKLESHLEGEMNYYRELLEMLEELN